MVWLSFSNWMLNFKALAHYLGISHTNKHLLCLDVTLLNSDQLFELILGENPE